MIDVNVILSVESCEQKVEVTCTCAARTSTARASDDDMYAAIDLLVDKLDRQVIKHKDKRFARHDSARASSACRRRTASA